MKIILSPSEIRSILLEHFLRTTVRPVEITGIEIRSNAVEIVLFQKEPKK